MSDTNPVFFYEYDSPVGTIRLVEQEGALTTLSMAGKAYPDAFLRRGEFTYAQAGDRLLAQGALRRETAFLAWVHEELVEYFAGERRVFTVPVRPAGTPFQQRVWQALCTIPYGQTRTYGQIAAQIGQPTASRAVGMGNHKNPVGIIIPCHRVIGADGSLTGYGGGLDIKEYLLKLEGILC